MTELRKGLPSLPANIAALPIDDRGYPIPWFVAEIDGKRDFRVADGRKKFLAAFHNHCWICGEKIIGKKSFVIGPMCAINCTTSEPPCHYDCAKFAAQACPFLILPRAEYRNANLPGQPILPTGAILGNPGACCIWTTRNFEVFNPRQQQCPDDFLFTIGSAYSVEWYAEGKRATRNQVITSVGNRIHFLFEEAKKIGRSEAMDELLTGIANFMKLLPPK